MAIRRLLGLTAVQAHSVNAPTSDALHGELIPVLMERVVAVMDANAHV